jgi:hypothetical protein
MYASIDLLLSTLERALAVAVLPGVANATAKDEAALGVLFSRWLRDVVDHAADAELASYDDGRAALADVAATIATARAGLACASELSAARALLERPPARSIAAIREESRLLKAHLCRALRAARQDQDSVLAQAIRRRLVELAAREIARDIAFGRAAGMDPDAARSPSLSTVLSTQREADRRTST